MNAWNVQILVDSYVCVSTTYKLICKNMVLISNSSRKQACGDSSHK